MLWCSSSYPQVSKVCGLEVLQGFVEGYEWCGVRVLGESCWIPSEDLLDHDVIHIHLYGWPQVKLLTWLDVLQRLPLRSGLFQLWVFSWEDLDHEYVEDGKSIEALHHKGGVWCL